MATFEDLPIEIRALIWKDYAELSRKRRFKEAQEKLSRLLQPPRRKRHLSSLPYQTFVYAGGKLRASICPSLSIMSIDYIHPTLKVELLYDMDPNHSLNGIAMLKYKRFISPLGTLQESQSTMRDDGHSWTFVTKDIMEEYEQFCMHLSTEDAQYLRIARFSTFLANVYGHFMKPR